MAFNFLGTIEKITDLDEFEEFVTIEIARTGDRIKHLRREIDNYSKLLQKFKEADLKLRKEYKKSKTADADWVVNPRPREKVFIKTIDTLTALDIDLLKRGFLDTIKFRRERNEFKIKRILDLMEQMNDEITLIQERQNDYLDILQKVRGRFEHADFIELTKTEEVDPADTNEGIRAIPKNAGTETINGKTYFNIVNINAASKLITFSTTAPPGLIVGESIIFSRGKNDGTKTFLSYEGTSSIRVQEELVEENNSKTLVYVPTTT